MIKYLLLLLLALLADCEWISEGKIFLNDVIVPLPVDQFRNISNQATIIDTRSSAKYLIKDSIWIPSELSSEYGKLLNQVLNKTQNQILLVLNYPPKDQSQKMKNIFQKMNYSVLGYNDFNVEKEYLDDQKYMVQQIHPKEFGRDYTWRRWRVWDSKNTSNVSIIDIRPKQEFNKQKVYLAQSYELNNLTNFEPDEGRVYFIYSSSSSYAKIGYSILKSKIDLSYVTGDYVYYDALAVEIDYATDDIWTSNQVSFAPVILCFISHAICTIVFTTYVWKRKQIFPHKQNSPLLTCIAHILLFASNLCFILTRISINSYSEVANIRELCEAFNKIIRWNFLAPDLIFTFCQQTIIFLYLLKLMRYYPVYEDNKLNKITKFIFSREWVLLIIAIFWSLIWTIIAFFLKYQDVAAGNKEGKKSGFQFYMFLCDSKCTFIDKALENSLYFSKLGLFLFLFLLAYGWSIKVSQKLNFRFQYAILLILYITPPMVEGIFHLSYHDQDDDYNYPSDTALRATRCESASYLVYYVYLICNLLASAFLLLQYYHRQDQQEDFFLDVQDFMSTTLYLMYSNKQTKFAIKQYAEYAHKQKYIRLYYLVQPADLPQLQQRGELKEWIEKFYPQIQQDVQKLKDKKKLEYDKLTHSSLTLFMRADRIRQFIVEKIIQIKEQWMETKSYGQIYLQMIQNSVYNSRMKELKLQ